MQAFFYYCHRKQTWNQKLRNCMIQPAKSQQRKQKTKCYGQIKKKAKQRCPAGQRR